MILILARIQAETSNKAGRQDGSVLRKGDKVMVLSKGVGGGRGGRGEILHGLN
jgi:hypothetical protein